MRFDTKVVFLLFLFIISVGYFFTYFFDELFIDDMKKMSIVRKQLLLVSEKIEEYNSLKNKYPSSLSDNDFIEFLGGTSIIDQFNPNNEILKYKKGDDYWVLYSVGPNQVDDGGIASDKKGGIDIVIKNTQ